MKREQHGTGVELLAIMVSTITHATLTKREPSTGSGA